MKLTAPLLAPLLLGLACSAGGGEDPGGEAPPGAGGSLSPPASGGGAPTLGLTPTPTRRADCLPGTYEGSFTGDIAFLGIIPAAASGTVVLTLGGTETPSGEFAELEVGNGAVTGDAGGGQYKATIVGKVNCAARKLEAGMLLDGFWNGFPPIAFEGPIAADYDAATKAFVNGTWSITGKSGEATGGGAWTAALRP